MLIRFHVIGSFVLFHLGCSPGMALELFVHFCHFAVRFHITFFTGRRELPLLMTSGLYNGLTLVKQIEKWQATHTQQEFMCLMLIGYWDEVSFSTTILLVVFCVCVIERETRELWDGRAVCKGGDFDSLAHNRLSKSNAHSSNTLAVFVLGCCQVPKTCTRFAYSESDADH
ncbi:hypothetical protein NC652_040371 [Populus alba x Populus x berolinensis]|nr:hypothetical protein NC652_040371 [Populus alba x Populus x berolinensis]